MTARKPDGYAVRMANGYWAGIWNDRETAELVKAKGGPGEQLLEMFAGELSTAERQTVAQHAPDAARGILQVLRGQHGATFETVRYHCRERGDDMTLWPKWAIDAEGYVTEWTAAALIYHVVQNAVQRGPV